MKMGRKIDKLRNESVTVLVQIQVYGYSRSDTQKQPRRAV